MKRTFLSLIGIAVLAALAAGCGTESGTNPGQEVTMGLTVGFDMTAPLVTIPGDGDAERISAPASAPDSVTITSGLMMLRSVRLNETVNSNFDTDITAADEDRDLGDASVRFQGPYIATIGDTDTDAGNATVPTGDYRQTTFVLQEARSTDNLNGHDELAGSSIQVAGKVWYKGVGHSFVFNTDYTTELGVTGDFSVTESTDGALRFVFAPRFWFHDGSNWLDPEDSANRVEILDNIRTNVTCSLETANY